jgi:hypothetical protein
MFSDARDVMRRPRRLLSAALLLLMAGAAWLFFWPKTDPSQACYDRIRIGMPELEADKILEEHGFVAEEGAGGEEMPVWFKRPGSRDTILICWIDGKISYKELVVERESGNVLSDLWHWFFGPCNNKAGTEPRGAWPN